MRARGENTRKNREIRQEISEKERAWRLGGWAMDGHGWK